RHADRDGKSRAAKPLAEPRGVRVEHAAGEKLVSDADDRRAAHHCGWTKGASRRASSQERAASAAAASSSGSGVGIAAFRIVRAMGRVASLPTRSAFTTGAKTSFMLSPEAGTMSQTIAPVGMTIACHDRLSAWTTTGAAEDRLKRRAQTRPFPATARIGDA